MLAHLIGGHPCAYTSTKSKKVATAVKNGKAPASSDDDDDGQPSKKRKLFQAVEKVMKQPELVVYRGAQIPFGAAEVERVHQQFLRTTMSANLPFRWVEDVEIVKLFMMFRSTACDVIPSRDVLSGTLLDAAWNDVEANLKKVLFKKYCVISTDGWKDASKNPINGVNLSTGGKPMVTKKDGESMCLAFEAMIDGAEMNYGCAVVLLVCDNDGGSQRGRKNVKIRRPWVLIAPCCTHQGQLMLGDYLDVNEDAFEVAEQATTVIYWIVSHDR
ncbi:hypothetical protein C8R46DRAFT_1225479 [Mycena filopes]|nr:hypothetical protein C8R46DRAFT_1225479 [Mycena filopes]